MFATLTSTMSQVGQLITVLLIFVFVLAITYLTTRWIAGFQKTQSLGDNIEVIESKRIAQNKAIEIVRIGDRYFAVAIGKDEVSLISEVSGDSLQSKPIQEGSFSFKEVFAKLKDNGDSASK